MSYLAPADAAYGAPVEEAYGAPSEQADDAYGAPEDYEEVAAPSELDNSYLSPAASAPVEEALGSYGAADESLDSYEIEAAASDAVDVGLKMLMTNVPGSPGEDYPIYAEAPETAFTCEGQVPGGESR